ncbi:hypothetical protein [Blastococcus xanthinilyticus]|uniref:Uncharacterized protein n=1 Tax=Blastococcus xanthinilyticus TaxID=1564164 RepID=A0A5S5D4E3_9ACTN|nr:hypothetical protein [Blastococcus xanthinilyticus]TYP90820.1 hypothetical protein BD833_101539 [Blastococcus xanthinilyticus]
MATARDAELVLDSAGPGPIAVGTALAAVVGYARGRRPLHFRAPNARTGRWVEIPAFGYERFDARLPATGPLGEADILTAEGLHGRLDPAAWSAMKAVLADVEPLAAAAVGRAAGRPLWELPEEEFSVLAEPGTVGAALRRIDELTAGTVPAAHVTAALHHRHPELVPLLVRVTRWQLLPHVREGDSGVEAVVHRELRANAAAFSELGAGLARHGFALTRLRVHDVLLWLSSTLRLSHAVVLGQALLETAAHSGSRPV